MSSSQPPAGPDGPEYLEQGGGAPLAQEPRGGSGNRKRLLVGGGAVAALALVGGGVWAAMSFFGQGPQPAEALPASTLGYASVDLDPSGGQKIEAIRMLRKFPAFEEEVGLETDDDLRERIFEESGLSETCDVDYGDDIEPWLGDRFAVAVVDLGEDQRVPVVVAQVRDADGADEGMRTLLECDVSNEDLGGWTVEGEWLVLAETTSIAEDVVAATADGTLADDADYQRWTEEAGDAGVVSLYAAPAAGQYLSDGALGLSAMASATTCDSDGDGADACVMPDAGSSPGGVPDELRELLEDFEGAAATLRFDDGALELELAGDATMTQNGFPVSDGGDDVLSTLPAGSAAAFGVGFTEGWFGQWLEQVASYGGTDVDALLAEAEAQTGLDLPEDLETLLGESAAVAISPDIDLDALVNSSSPEGLPIGLKVQGEPEEIEAVLEKLRETFVPEPEVLLSETDGDTVTISFSEDYLAELAEDGELGDSETFENVVREAEDAGSILFVDFDAGDDWLVSLAEGDQEAVENLEPLEGLGMSGWVDDEVGHVVLRITTD